MAVLLCVCLSLTVCVWTVSAFPLENGPYVQSLPRHEVTRTRRDAEGELGRYSCGAGQCVCKGTHADCGGKDLRYIPQLPSVITSLDFAVNFPFEVPPNVTDNFFENITTVTWLDLRANAISNIGSNAFQILTHLTYLDISLNFLTCDDLSVVFNIPTLEVLILWSVEYCGRFEDVAFREPTPRLQELFLSTLGVLDLTRLSRFTGLRSLTLTFINRIHNFHVIHSMTNLTYLDLSFGRLSCRDQTLALTIPSLKVLNISGSVDCDVFPDISIGNHLPALEELNLGSNPNYNTLNLTRLLPFTGLKRLLMGRTDVEPNVKSTYHVLHQLTHLTFLDLSANKLSCDQLLTVLTIPSLEELRVSAGTVCTKLVPDGRWLNTSLLYVNKSKLAKLDLSRNGIQRIDILDTLTELQYVDISYNEITSIAINRIFPRLHTLHMQRNYLKYCIETCINGSSLFPFLLELDVSENELSQMFDIKTCLPRLQTLKASANKLTDLVSRNTTFKSLSRLETLDISAQGIYTMQEDSFMNSQLTSLNLANNDIRFDDEEDVDSDSFLGCGNLASLLLDNNLFVGVRESRFQDLFGHLIHLTHLSLKSTRFSYITAGMFHGLTSLQSLDLGNNDLVRLPDALFESLSHLVSVDLSSNKIAIIQESALTFATRQRFKHVDLSSNPFACTCDVLWFRKWLINNPSVFQESWGDYICGNLPDTLVESFSMQDQACLLSPETNKFIIATVSLIFIVMSLLTFLYRYRWHIRLMLHEVFRAPGERLRRLREHRFQYDVFVSYGSADFPWVRDHLMPGLEEGLGLKLCLHQRDFELGYPISENIMDTVLTSKKLLMLFSRSFAQSQWCQFELQLCLSHAMDTQDVLIVVMLEDIPSRELTPAMLAVMKTTTYIEWADDADARDSFWRRMGLALHEILPL